MKVPVRRVQWRHCWRIIPTRYPSESLLERVADARDIPAIEELDGLTSTRLRMERGEISYLAAGERASGPGSQYIMASFAYSLFNNSRFGDGSYGVYYGAGSLLTAILETRFHREEFLRFTSESRMMLSMRVLDSCLDGNLHDIRGLKKKQPHLYSPRSYTRSESFARELWERGSEGIVYDSVRDPGGECVAVFKPSLLHHCREERSLLYEWDGRRIGKVYELQEFIEMK